MPLSACVSTGTPSTGREVQAAAMPGRWAAPPAPAMITRNPRSRADAAYWRSLSGVRCAETIRHSCGTPSAVNVSDACDMVAQSDWLPMMRPTRAMAISAGGMPDGGMSGWDTLTGPSGDVVGDQAAFQPADLIAQHELALLQALQMQLVDRALFSETRDHRVKVAMLASQFMQFAQQGIPIDQHTLSLPRK